MGASVVRRHDLDVERVIASIHVVLDADVRELDVAPVVAGQVVLPCPVLDFQRIAIGSAIASRFEAFRTAVTVVARTAREQDGRHVHGFDELPALARDTHVLVLITPLTDETERLVDAELLAALPDGALVVNVARGRVVDTDALVSELQTGRLSAALDVTDPEPLPTGHPLWTTPNTVLTPHVGGNTDLSVPRSIELMRRQVAALAAGRPFENVIDR